MPAVIKQFRLVTRRRDVSSGEFTRCWPRAVACAALAPVGPRPLRATLCSVLPGYGSPGVDAEPRHDGVGIEWFADTEHLERFQDWLTTRRARLLRQQTERVVDPDASPTVLAEECVLRGADWLERRWQEGGQRLKHLALAVRAHGLTPADFSARWRNHAGQLRSSVGRSVAIPAEARGAAYVQNHPLPRGGVDWAYDALNEVYFDDAQGLRTRVDWLHANLGDGDELFGRSWFLAVRETPIL